MHLLRYHPSICAYAHWLGPSQQSVFVRFMWMLLLFFCCCCCVFILGRRGGNISKTNDNKTQESDTLPQWKEAHPTHIVSFQGSGTFFFPWKRMTWKMYELERGWSVTWIHSLRDKSDWQTVYKHLPPGPGICTYPGLLYATNQPTGPGCKMRKGYKLRVQNTLWKQAASSFQTCSNNHPVSAHPGTRLQAKAAYLKDGGF